MRPVLQRRVKSSPPPPPPPVTSDSEGHSDTEAVTKLFPGFNKCPIFGHFWDSQTLTSSHLGKYRIGVLAKRGDGVRCGVRCGA